MKKNIISITIFFLLAAALLTCGIIFDIRLFPAGFLFAILFFAYLLAFINEKKQAKKEEREYNEVKYPSKYLLISNSLGMLTILSIATALESANTVSYKGLVYMLVIIFVLPVNAGIYFLILLKYLINKNKQAAKQ